jgi:hypothetical protein
MAKSQTSAQASMILATKAACWGSVGINPALRLIDLIRKHCYRCWFK